MDQHSLNIRMPEERNKASMPLTVTHSVEDADGDIAEVEAADAVMEVKQDEATTK